MLNLPGEPRSAGQRKRRSGEALEAPTPPLVMVGLAQSAELRGWYPGDTGSFPVPHPVVWVSVTAVAGREQTSTRQTGGGREGVGRGKLHPRHGPHRWRAKQTILD